MVIGVKVWAFAHLLSNGRLGDVLLFGSILAWAVLDFRAARGRNRAAAKPAAAATWTNTALAAAIGAAAWFVFARYLHAALIGVAVT
jgi:uncharacterized membrane protein